MVVSIIALLIALLLPSLNKAREAARNVACQANQHGMALAMAAYASSNDNRNVPAQNWSLFGDPKTFDGGNDRWQNVLMSGGYLGAAKFKWPENDAQLDPPTPQIANIFICPTMRITLSATPTPPDVTLSPAMYCYGLNLGPMLYSVYGQYGGGTGEMAAAQQLALPLNRISQPGGTACALEASHAEEAWRWGTPPNGRGTIPHFAGGNVLFFDGHVDWMALDRMPAGSTGWTYSPTDADMNNPFWIGR